MTKNYLIAIVIVIVIGAAEILIVDKGGALPSNLISTDEAIARPKAVPGYANVAIISVEAIYGRTAANDIGA